MKSQNSLLNHPKKTFVNILEIIDTARVAEKKRDMQASRKILSPIWNDFETEPDFSQFEPGVEANLLRLCGMHLCLYGHAKGEDDYQERAKNLISQAISIFGVEKMLHEACEAKVMLSTAYLYAGQNEEVGIILDEVLPHYHNNELHPVYLLTQINKIGVLHWKRDYQEALEVLSSIKIPMEEVCDDAALLAQYHNQAGFILGRVERYQEATTHYEKAIINGEKAGRVRGVGISLNNLAYLNSSHDKNKEANENIVKALNIFEELGDAGWIAIVLDTKALVHLRENKLDLALESIEEAIGLFKKGERYSALTDALWVKICILLRADKKEEAFYIFSELSEIASSEIGQYAVTKYSKQLAEIVYSIKDIGFHKEVRAFKRQLIKDSFSSVNMDTKRAAKKLKIDEDKLLNILDKQFPSIYDEVGIRNKPTLVSRSVNSSTSVFSTK